MFQTIVRVSVLLVLLASVWPSQLAQDDEPARPEPTRLVLLNLEYDQEDRPKSLVATGVEVSDANDFAAHATRRFDVSEWQPTINPMSAPSVSNPYAATAGDRFAYVATRHEGNGNRLHRFDAFDREAEALTVKLGEITPTALIEAGGLLCVGAPDQVLEIDLNADDPKAVSVHRRRPKPAPHEKEDVIEYRKEVDAFAWCGDLLVAVDNIVHPKYAFVLKLVDGNLRYLYTSELPAFANSQYYEAAGNGDTLVVASHFHNSVGTGNRLCLFRVTDESLEYVRSISELFPREGRVTRRPPKRLADGEDTLFQGLEIHSDRVLVGAGSRGMIVVPLDQEDEPTSVNLGGDCTDMVLRGERVFALVQQDENSVTTLVSLTFGEDAWAVDARHKLKFRAQLFAD